MEHRYRAVFGSVVQRKDVNQIAETLQRSLALTRSGCERAAIHVDGVPCAVPGQGLHRYLPQPASISTPEVVLGNIAFGSEEFLAVRPALF